MPRDYHSPSGVEKMALCEYRAAMHYIAGVLEPRTTATDFGTRMHEIAERYFRREEIDQATWSSPEGLAFAHGLHFVPRPDECALIEVERPIGEGYGVRLPEGLPLEWALELHGVRWGGFRDLAVDVSSAARSRLGLEPHGVVLYDWKSSADASRYAKSPADLAVDAQRCLYGVDVCEQTDWHVSVARWVYFDKKRASRTRAVDSVQSRAACEDAIEKPASIARNFDALTSVEDARRNPRACDAWNRRCPYHSSEGGPCDARPSLGALIQARTNRPQTKGPQVSEPAWKQRLKQRSATSEPTPVEAAAGEVPALVAEPEPPKPTPPKVARPKAPVEAPAPADDDVVTRARARIAGAESIVAAIRTVEEARAAVEYAAFELRAAETALEKLLGEASA